MNKSKLERFIQKYSLGGAVDSVKWVVKDNKLMTSFIDSGRTLLGTVIVDKFNFQDAVLGVYSTSQLMRLLNVVGDSVELELVSVNGYELGTGPDLLYPVTIILDPFFRVLINFFSTLFSDIQAKFS